MFFSLSALGSTDPCPWKIAGGTATARALGLTTYDAQALISFDRSGFGSVFGVARVFEGPQPVLGEVAELLNASETGGVPFAEVKLEALLARVVAPSELPILLSACPRPRPLVANWSFPADWRERLQTYMATKVSTADVNAYFDWMKRIAAQGKKTLGNADKKKTVQNGFAENITVGILPYIDPANSTAESVLTLGPNSILNHYLLVGTSPKEAISRMLAFIMRDTIRVPWTGDSVRAAIIEQLSNRTKDQYDALVARFQPGGARLEGWKGIDAEEADFMERYALKNTPKEKKVKAAPVAAASTPSLDLSDPALLELFVEETLLDSDDTDRFLIWYRSLNEIDRREFTASLPNFSVESLNPNLVERVEVENQTFYVQRALPRGAKRETPGRLVWVVLDGKPRIAAWYLDPKGNAKLADQPIVNVALLILNPPAITVDYLKKHLLRREDEANFLEWWKSVSPKERAAYLETLQAFSPIDLSKQKIEKAADEGTLSKISFSIGEISEEGAEHPFYVMIPTSKAINRAKTRLVVYLEADEPLIVGWYFEDGTPALEQPTVIQSISFLKSTF